MVITADRWSWSARSVIVITQIGVVITWIGDRDRWYLPSDWVL